MKIRYLALVSLAMTLCVGFIIAQSAPGPAPAAEKTPLAKEMIKMDDERTDLTESGQLNDPKKNADSIAKITIMRNAAIAAQKLRPVRTDTVSKDEQAKFLTDYKAQMQKLVDALGKIQDALKANNNPVAVDVFASLRDIQMPAHQQFRPARGGRSGAPGGPPGGPPAGMGGRGPGGPGAPPATGGAAAPVAPAK